MSSFVSSILHSSANKFDSKYKNKSKDIGSRLSLNGSTPTLLATSSSSSPPTHGYYYHHPQKSYSAEYIPAPPPYDIQHHSPVPTPSTSWTSEMSALAEKIKDDVTNTLKGNKSVTPSQQSNIDRRSISQGMKLVSIAADEYEGGNEADALGIYLTGVDKILMALPNKTNINTKMAIREKLSSVEERVGLINVSNNNNNTQKKMQPNSTTTPFQLNSFVLSSIASTISTISTKAYQSATCPPNSITEIDNQNDTLTTNMMPTLYLEEGGGDTMIKFKKLGQYLIDLSVTCAVLVKQSPLPDLISFLFSYIIQLMIWIDSHYHITQKAQDLGVECIKVGLAANEKYRLHEFVTEGLYMLITAGLKAIVAFKEAPRHDEKFSSHHHHIKRKSSSIPVVVQQQTSTSSSPSTTTKPCLPSTPQKTRTSWAWSRW